MQGAEAGQGDLAEPGGPKRAEPGGMAGTASGPAGLVRVELGPGGLVASASGPAGITLPGSGPGSLARSESGLGGVARQGAGQGGIIGVGPPGMGPRPNQQAAGGKPGTGVGVEAGPPALPPLCRASGIEGATEQKASPKCECYFSFSLFLIFLFCKPT